MRLPTILLAAALLAGCASPGTIESDKLAELAVGRTTSAELVSAWGPPLAEATLPDGRRQLTYRTIHMQTGPITAFAPGVGPIGSSTETMTGQATLTFDAQGVLMSYAYTR